MSPSQSAAAQRPDTQARDARVREYFGKYLNEQQQWYSKKADFNKRWHTWLGLVTVAAGALTVVLQVWTPRPASWVAVSTAILGAIVVLSKGVERLWGFDEAWLVYRHASEAMKREHRLYIYAAGPYTRAPDEESAYRQFVERIEDVIASEHSGFVERARGSSLPPGEPG